MSARLRLAPFAAALAVIVVAVSAPGRPASAQSLAELTAERRLEYEAARQAWTAAGGAFSVEERRFSQALEAVNAARRGGSEDDLERALQLAQDRSVPYRAAERRVEATRARMEEARAALSDVLAARMEELVERMERVASTRERSDLDALFRDLSSAMRELDADAGDGFRPEPVVLPEIVFDPRDGPEELRVKAQLLERRAAVADTVIQDVDRRIRTLNDRIRLERQRRDFLAGTERFDDTRVPVVAGGPVGEELQAADSAGAAGRSPTLEDRVGSLRAYREQLEGYRDQLLIRAEQFRRRLRTVT